MRRSAPLLVGLSLGLLGVVASPAAAQEGAFDACEERFAAEPDDWKGCGCFYRVARARGLQDQAIARLEQHLARHADDACLPFYLGRLLAERNDERAILHLRHAAEGYGGEGVPEGEAYARINLAQALSRAGASGVEVTDELAAAARAAGAVEEPGTRGRLEGWVVVQEAKLLAERTGDVGLAEDSLRRARRETAAGAAPTYRRAILSELGNVLQTRGRYIEAEEVFDELVALTTAESDDYARATALQNRATAIGAQEPFAARREEVAEVLGEAIGAATASGNVPVEIAARMRLGQILGGPEGREQLHLALAAAERVRDERPEYWAAALAASAADLVDEDPNEARRRVEEASSYLALMVHDPWSVVYAWADRFEVLWKTGGPSEVLPTARRLREIVDRLEEAQSTESARAEVSAVWTEVDQWLAGRLLEAYEADGDEALLAAAFDVSERMRARLLLESLAAGGVTPAGEAALQDRSAWLGVERDLARLHRRLLDPRLSTAERDALEDELRILEIQEDRLAAQRRVLRRRAISAPESFVSLDALRSSLEPDQAVLAFQVGSWATLDGRFGGGSWLSVVTREGTRVHRLPERSELADLVEVYLGLFPHRDGRDAEAAAGLHERLFGSALDELPAGVERLVVIPDGPLHRLPFATLRPSPAAPTLIERYQIFSAPSATAWHRLREAPSRGETIVGLADPISPLSAASTGDDERAWRDGLVLPALPHSRREVETALRFLATNDRIGRLLLGDEASAAQLVRAIRDGVRLVHLGSHAVLDETNPHRSAVILSPDGPDDDPLLRPREAADLDLDGAVVVLASCQSAQGTVLRGEGALSLSRAFLEGGARTVVGSLWPLVDAEAAEVFERFYWHLGRGETVAGALARAQRESARAGRPAHAWAGLVVLGDGDAVVVAEPRPYAVAFAASLEPWEWVAGLATLLLLASLGTLAVLRLRAA